mgnify:CR=1 FL=1
MDSNRSNVTDSKKGDLNIGVKKSFRPEWLDSENSLFINKLNYCAKHFEPTHNLVSFHFSLMAVYLDLKT